MTPPLFTIPPPCTTKPSVALQARVFERDHFACVYCGVSGVPVQLDHVRAKAHHAASAPRSTVNDPSNLVTACVPCNAAKGPQDLAGFARMLRGRGIPAATIRVMLGRVRAATRRRLPLPPVS